MIKDKICTHNSSAMATVKPLEFISSAGGGGSATIFFRKDCVVTANIKIGSGSGIGCTGFISISVDFCKKIKQFLIILNRN